MFNPLLWFQKKVIKHQIEDFISWKKQISTISASTHESNLLKFLGQTSLSDIRKLTEEEVYDFAQTQRTNYQIVSMKKSLLQCIAFHRRLIIESKNDTFNSLMKTPVGRKPHIHKIRQVKKLREQGISIRAISRIMHVSPAMIQKWAAYPDKRLEVRALELSTD
jgi:transposase-like protein